MECFLHLIIKMNKYIYIYILKPTTIIGRRIGITRTIRIRITARTITFAIQLSHIFTNVIARPSKPTC